MTTPSDMSIDFVSEVSGQRVSLLPEDIRLANQLLERMSLEVEMAYSAIECAAALRPRVFGPTPPNPSAAVAAWNAATPVGSAVRFFPEGRPAPARHSRTASVAFDMGGFAAVLVEEHDCAVSLADAEPL